MVAMLKRFCPETYGAMGNGIADDSAAVAECFAQAEALAALGGSALVYLARRYAISSGVVVTTSRVKVCGAGAGSGFIVNGDFTALKFTGASAGVSRYLAAPLAENDNIVELADATGLSIGTVLEFRVNKVLGSGTYNHQWFCEVVDVSGAFVKLSVPASVSIADIGEDYVIIETNMLDGVGADNFEIIGGIGVGPDTRGVVLEFARWSEIDRISGADLPGAAIEASYGLKNRFGVGWLHAEHCGSMGDSDTTSSSDIRLWGQTAPTIGRLTSNCATGFGPKIAKSTRFYGGVISSFNAAGRAVKLQGVRHFSLDAVAGHNAGKTGPSITLNSGRGYIGVVEGDNNTERGLWFSDQDNCDIVIGVARCRGNTLADIAVHPSDARNVIQNADYATLTNTGKAVIGAANAKACFSAHKGGTNQTGVPPTTFTQVTFPVERFDVGGCFDPSTGIAKFPSAPAPYAVELSATLFLSGLTSGSAHEVDIYKNGALFQAGLVVRSTGTSAGVTVSCIDLTDGSDEYTVQVHLNSPTTGTISGLIAYTRFEGRQL